MSSLDFNIDGVTEQELLEAVLAKLQGSRLANISRSTVDALVAVLAGAIATPKLEG